MRSHFITLVCRSYSLTHTYLPLSHIHTITNTLIDRSPQLQPLPPPPQQREPARQLSLRHKHHHHQRHHYHQQRKHHHHHHHHPYHQQRKHHHHHHPYHQQHKHHHYHQHYHHTLCNIDSWSRDNFRQTYHSHHQHQHLLSPSPPPHHHHHTLHCIGKSRSKANCRKMKQLPKGRGKYEVGAMDLMTEQQEDQSGSFLRIYYPTMLNPLTEGQSTSITPNTLTPTVTPECNYYASTKNDHNSWLPKSQYRDGYIRFIGKENSALYNCLFNWFGGHVLIPVRWMSPVYCDQSHTTFPVVVFSHGLGGMRTTYSTLCVDLASHGFIVVTVEHRDGSASATYYLTECSLPNEQEGSNVDQNEAVGRVFQEEWKLYEQHERDDFELRNKQVKIREQECIQALDLLHKLNKGETVCNLLNSDMSPDHFKNHLDLSNVCIAGHSFGGATAIMVLANDKRFSAGVVLDAWMLPLEDNVYPKVSQPVLMLNTETFQWRQNVLKMKMLESERDNRIMLTQMGTCHQSTTDFQFLCNHYMARMMGFCHNASPKEAVELSGKIVQGFLCKILGLVDQEFHEDLLNGKHESLLHGTNVNFETGKQ
ncbi:platelet-activating factor acetylhydrolase-like [Argonauta hians]